MLPTFRAPGPLVVLVSAAVFGCAGATDLARAHEPIQTDSLHYQLVFDGVGYHVRIPYVFTNQTGGTVYIENCRGAFYLHLERKGSDEGHAAWAAAIPKCLSGPIVIDKDMSFTDTLDVWGAPPGGNWYPQFDRTDPSGTYRIVWDGTSIPRSARLSNWFALAK